MGGLSQALPLTPRCSLGLLTSNLKGQVNKTNALPTCSKALQLSNLHSTAQRQIEANPMHDPTWHLREKRGPRSSRGNDRGSCAS